MRLVPGNVGRTVAARLVLAWLALSLLAGAATLYLELERVSRMVLGLASNEARGLTAHIEALGSEHAAALRKQATQFLEGDFVSLRLYDARKDKILEVFDPDTAHAARRLPEHVHDLAPGEMNHHHMFWIDGRILMQLLLPIEPERGGRGYFEGVYQVDDATLGEIKTGVSRSLALTLGVVLTTAAVLYSVIAVLNRSLVRLSSDLLRSNVELMEVLGSAVALRDSATDAHNYRVTAYAMAVGKALRLPATELRNLIAGAFLHDVGKIGVGDAILLKRGALMPEEIGKMRSHVSLGVGVIAGSSWLRAARDIVEFHHEKFDGSGYLAGLAGDAIPLNARLFAVIDAFDALTSRRPYKEPLSVDAAIAVLERGRGTHFDPALLDAFLGVARAVHAQIVRAGDDVLRRRVRRQVAKHFRLADTADQ